LSDAFHSVFAVARQNPRTTLPLVALVLVATLLNVTGQSGQSEHAGTIHHNAMPMPQCDGCMKGMPMPGCPMPKMCPGYPDFANDGGGNPPMSRYSPTKVYAWVVERPSVNASHLIC
jgi:hypothetical protein